MVLQNSLRESKSPQSAQDIPEICESVEPPFFKQVTGVCFEVFSPLEAVFVLQGLKIAVYISSCE